MSEQVKQKLQEIYKNMPSDKLAIRVHDPNITALAKEIAQEELDQRQAEGRKKPFGLKVNSTKYRVGTVLVNCILIISASIILNMWVFLPVAAAFILVLLAKYHPILGRIVGVVLMIIPVYLWYVGAFSIHWFFSLFLIMFSFVVAGIGFSVFMTTFDKKPLSIFLDDIEYRMENLDVDSN